MVKNNFKKSYKDDLSRYEGKIPHYEKRFLYLLRKCQNAKKTKVFWKALFRLHCRKRNIEISCDTKIGNGLYVGHFYNVTINPETIIGEKCNIHKNVTIGQENRGERKGTPTIGSKVYFGVNSVVVGKITIGDDVMICANAFVNFDVPSHSIVLGNPGKIIHKEGATDGYIQN